MHRKPHAQKVAAAEDRKVLSRRILRVIRENSTLMVAGKLTFHEDVITRLAALARELEDTK